MVFLVNLSLDFDVNFLDVSLIVSALCSAWDFVEIILSVSCESDQLFGLNLIRVTTKLSML